MHELLSVRRLDLPDVSSLVDLLDFFEGCFLNLRLSQNGVLSAHSNSLLRVDIPFNTKMEPDMLRVVLPDSFPCQERTRSVVEKLRSGTHIFAAAVSGAGKTKLAFDVAQHHFAFYFDMNGGHGKVAQMDVMAFMEHCELLNKRHDRELDDVVPEFKHLIASLFLARWIALAVAKKRFPGLTPAQWLWMQTDFADLSQACYLKCVALPTGAMSTLLDLLKEGPSPLVLIDEAQKLLAYDYWFRSSRAPDQKRPLGYAMVGWLAQHGLACLCSGTNLRLKDFHAIRSASGGDDDWKMQYDFDFLDQKAVWQLIDHFLNTSQMLGLDSVLALLQGRPRFAAAAIKACLGGGNPVQSILAYTQRMIVESEGEASIRANWKRLYEDGATAVMHGAGAQTVWSIAFSMLTRSLFVPSDGEDEGARVTFLLDEHREVVSRGVSMIKRIEGKAHEFMAEPLVLSAGVSFCMEHPGLDIAADLLAKLNDVTTSDPQHRGKLLEFLVAAQVYKCPDRFMEVQSWPATVQLPKHRPFGVLVGVPLTDPRLNFSTFDQCPLPGAVYWLALPENQAGPDLVAPRMLFSMKTTSNDRVSSEESKKSIKTTTPSKLYTGSGGAALQGQAWTQKLKETQKAIENWKAPIVRVRVELPACSPGTEPAENILCNGKWNCTLGDVQDWESRPSDVMLYFDANSCKDTLGIDWNSFAK